MSASGKNYIRPETAAAILSCFRESVRSRSEIAAETGLSLMTIGRVLELLTAAGWITSVSLETKSVGRRASASTVSGGSFFLIADLTEGRRIRTDVSLHLLEETECSQDSSDIVSFTEGLILSMMDGTDFRHCLGIGILTKHDDPKTQEISENYSRMTFPIIVRSIPQALASAYLENGGEEDAVWILHVSEHIRGVYRNRGSVIRGGEGYAGDIDLPLDEALPYLQSASVLLKPDEIFTDAPVPALPEAQLIQQDAYPLPVRGILEELRLVSLERVIHNT